MKQLPFLRAEWRKLVMANYVVPPDLLKPYLPAQTELDDYNGQVFLSLVGMMFYNTRVVNVRVPFHITFPEVNLRFYVRYKDINLAEGSAVTVFRQQKLPRLHSF